MTVQPLRDHEWCIPHDHIEPDPDIWGPVAVDPIRPPETDEEPWTHPRLGVVSVRGDDDRYDATIVLLVIAFGVIVAILVAWAVR